MIFKGPLSRINSTTERIRTDHGRQALVFTNMDCCSAIGYRLREENKSCIFPTTMVVSVALWVSVMHSFHDFSQKRALFNSVVTVGL